MSLRPACGRYVIRRATANEKLRVRLRLAYSSSNATVIKMELINS